MILCLPLTAFAKEKNEGRPQRSDAVEIGSTRLQPGTYKVEWKGAGPGVQVKLIPTMTSEK
jgi:hypothetical protein